MSQLMHRFVWFCLAQALLHAVVASLPGNLPDKQRQRQLAKERLLSKSRLLQDSQLTIDAYEHLLEITVDANGDPNPRITCTEGFKYAADYVADQMKEIGLVPMGDLQENGTRSFLQTVPGAVDEMLCPAGMMNIVGMVEGSEFPNEYVVYSAHLDGTINKNPQTRFERGIQHTDNAYDDAFAVAVGLAMAKRMIENPPATSVMFMFEFHEEVWLHLIEYCEDRKNTEWIKTVFRETGWPEPPQDECPHRGFGISKWLNTPVIDFANVKLIVFVDPLGSSYNVTANFLAAIGGEYVTVHDTTSNNKTDLNSFLDKVWPIESSVELFKINGGSVTETGYGGSEGVVTRDYGAICGESCISAGGLPAIWLAQPAFQRYHGGEAVHFVRDLFNALSNNGYEDLLGNGTFPSPIYFTLDTVESFYRPNIDATVTALSDFMANVANRVGSYQIQFDEKRYKNFRVDESDVENMVSILSFVLSVGSQVLPMAVQGPLLEIASTLKGQAQLMTILNLTDPVYQGNAKLLGKAVVALALSLDFFNPYYPGHEPYEDQVYASPEVDALVANESSPADPPVEVAGKSAATFSFDLWMSAAGGIGTFLWSLCAD